MPSILMRSGGSKNLRRYGTGTLEEELWLIHAFPGDEEVT